MFVTIDQTLRKNNLY